MKQLVVHRDYSTSLNCQIEISAIFQGIFGIFAIFQNVCLFRDFSQTSGLKTMVYSAHFRWTNLSTEHWQSDSYEQELKYLENDPSQCHPVRRKRNMSRPGPKAGPVWW